MSTLFLRARPWNFARVYYALAEPFTDVFFCFLLFFAENVGSLKTQISPKTTKTQISDEKNKKQKKKSLKARQGHIKHVCKISGSLKNGVDNRRLKEFGGLCLNQPVTATHPTRLGLKVHCISETLNVHYVPHQTGFLNL